jgi:hypothetical protein
LDEAEAFLDVEELYDADAHHGLQTGTPEKSGSLRNPGDEAGDPARECGGKEATRSRDRNGI